MRKKWLIGYRCNAAKVKEIIEFRGFRSKISRTKSPSDISINRKFNILNTWGCMLFVMLQFFFLLSSGYAMDITLQWTPNEDSNLAGYTVYYRQEGQSYDYRTPYWETTDPTCIIYDLDETQTYYFTVRAVSNEGFQSGDSNEVCLKEGTITNN